MSIVFFFVTALLMGAAAAELRHAHGQFTEAVITPLTIALGSFFLALLIRA